MANDKKIWFDKTFIAMEVLLGLTERDDLVFMGSEFGNMGWNLILDQKHIDYFTELNSHIQTNEKTINHF